MDPSISHSWGLTLQVRSGSVLVSGTVWCWHWPVQACSMLAHVEGREGGGEGVPGALRTGRGRRP